MTTKRRTKVPPVAIDEETFVFEEVDPRIQYPSYVSFDEFVDVERLRSLDGYIVERIRRHIAEQKDDEKFYTGPYRISDSFPAMPGSRMIYLSTSDRPDSYFDLDQTELWRPGEAAKEFELLMDLIDTFPFKAKGRMLIMYDDSPNEVPAHRDHVETEILHDFIWFRTNMAKPLYMLNYSTGERQYVDGYTAWFDTVNQFHGIDGVDGLSFSIRIDGKFTDVFNARISRPPINAASTPSFWASTRQQEASR